MDLVHIGGPQTEAQCVKVTPGGHYLQSLQHLCIISALAVVAAGLTFLSVHPGD